MLLLNALKFLGENVLGGEEYVVVVEHRYFFGILDDEREVVDVCMTHETHPLLVHLLGVVECQLLPLLTEKFEWLLVVDHERAVRGAQKTVADHDLVVLPKEEHPGVQIVPVEDPLVLPYLQAVGHLHARITLDFEGD